MARKSTGSDPRSRRYFSFSSVAMLPEIAGGGIWSGQMAAAAVKAAAIAPAIRTMPAAADRI
ncbi:hypothetical protein DWF04_006690 [Cereibacter sphaeroides f. sp. denitrificans]